MKTLYAAIALMVLSVTAVGQSNVTGVIPQYSGGLVTATTGSIVANAPINAQGNFTIPVPSNPTSHVMTFTPASNSPYSPFNMTITAGAGTTNITAQIQAVVPQIGIPLGIINAASVATDANGNAIPGSSSGGSVPSVFGRTGAIVAQANDYSADQIASGTVTGHGWVCGNGCVWTTASGGFNNANEINGLTLPVSAAGLASNSSGQITAQTAVQAASTLFVPLAGATADYKFQDGTGTTVSDSSGNGNTATFNSSGPTWTSTGLSFVPGQGVALPAALNGTQTFVAAFYWNPLTTGFADPANTYPMVITSSLENNGANLTEMIYNGGLVNNLEDSNYPGVFHSGGQTVGLQSGTGFHVVAWTLGILGITVDHIYIDGVEVPYTPPQGSNAGIQTSGNFFIGANLGSLFGASGMWGTMYRLRTYSSVLSPTQVIQTSQSIRQDVASRGVPVSPTLSASVLPVIHFIGDSITFGLGVSNPYPLLISLTSYPTFTPVNWGVPSVRLQAIVANETNRVALQCTTTFGPAIASVFAGTNDWTTQGSGFTNFSALENLFGEVQVLKKAGCQVFVVTMISRGPRGGTVPEDPNKDIYDAQMLQFWKQGGADGVIDVAANPLLGADGAYANTTYFQSDQVHPTQAGQQLLANAFQNTLNYFFGNNIANPNVVTANTYQMLSSDGAVTAAPTGNAAYTMPDCTGPSGVTYTISNPQSADTLSIVGQANQPINGQTGTINIPSNSTVTLRDVANPKTVSGCHWVM